ncbi:glutamine amidotransferase-related protein [Leptolyngbya sp. NK1-12]|uniref:glutamine amidotransferase-related protein n=1 Tax=Leptolyngbya sp. NK1-12 TaxID=2547451 RepID=UPI002931E11F|nr:glutamine amidotransferase [Leptolyngbya sp. NK1-12]
MSQSIVVKKILVITHQASSETGLVGQVLQAEGCWLDIRCPAIGTSLPDHLDAHDGVVIFGGPMSANDDTTLPFIRDELNWIPLVLEAQKPFLGICLGAQMLARVLGAKVAPHPDDWREIGYATIQPTPHQANPLAELTHVYHWHKEGFELPQDAVLLATGDHFANQAFRYGSSAYGLQFHPEITQSMIDRWTTEAADQLNFPGAQPRECQFQAHDHHGVSVATWLQQFLPQWLSPSLSD